MPKLSARQCDGLGDLLREIAGLPAEREVPAADRDLTDVHEEIAFLAALDYTDNARPRAGRVLVGRRLA